MNIDSQVIQMLARRGGTIVWSTDVDLRITSIRGSFISATNESELHGKIVSDVAGPIVDCILDSHQQALTGGTWESEIELAERMFEVRIDPLRSDDGTIVGTIGVAQDVTARREAEKSLQWRSTHDPVTNLPNRVHMRELLAKSVQHARQHDTDLAILIVDFDGFRSLNVVAGSAAADSVLVAASHRLASVAGDHCITRTGDNEFTIIVDGVPADLVRDLAGEILAAFENPFIVDDNDVRLTASIGIADLARERDCADALLRAATAAVRHAKELGGNQRQQSSIALTGAEIERLQIESKLRRALKNGELQLYYQPQIRLSDRKIVGFEALLRWMRDGRVVSPATFIRAIEHSPVIVTLGDWVINETCRQIRAWRDTGVVVPRVAFNIGARHFQQSSLPATIGRALSLFSLPGTALELEITETTAMYDVDQTAQTVDELRELGMEITIDDFGTGYSSLAYLKKFAVTALKIDRSFVSDVPTSRSATAIVSAIVATARALDLRVVAEGVETPEQANFLTSAGCLEAQGYWFAQPMQAEDVPLFLENYEGGQ